MGHASTSLTGREASTAMCTLAPPICFAGFTLPTNQRTLLDYVVASLLGHSSLHSLSSHFFSRNTRQKPETTIYDAYENVLKHQENV